MKHAFSPAGKQALRETMQRNALLAFDFDGTLAPIVPRPEAAAAPSAIAQRLARLASLRPVAVITGRAGDDVRSRLGFTPQYVIGNHGAERSPSDRLAPAAGQLDPLRARLGASQSKLAAAGVTVEDKRLSIALHYRTARELAHAMAVIEEVLRDAGSDVRIFGGKCVVNVVPAGVPDKAGALLALVAQTGADTAVFLGDDVNDEVVFELAPPHWFTVLVGRAPQGSRARFFVDGQNLVATLLQDMLDLLTGRSGA